MSRAFHHGRNRDRIKVRIRAVKRDKPDFKRLSRALIELAEAELEKEAQCEHRKLTPAKKNKGGKL